MRGNGLGDALAGGANADRPGAAMRKRAAMLTNTAGFPIPEAFKERLARFDTNGDGNPSAAEIDARPEPARSRVRQAVEARTGKPSHHIGTK